MILKRPLYLNSLIQATWITWRGQSHTTTMRMNSLDVNSLNPNAPMASSRKEEFTFTSRFSKGSPMNEQNDSWPSRESVAGRSECSIEQKPSNVKATTDFAQRLDRTITEDTERPHLAYYNTSSCNSQYAWQTLITYDACICLCLQAWARGCTEAPEFLKDECLALRSAFGMQIWKLSSLLGYQIRRKW
ncbi:hypothetical protein AAHE18_04G087600 [Arachis hypogaea]